LRTIRAGEETPPDIDAPVGPRNKFAVRVVSKAPCDNKSHRILLVSSA